jgi:transcriptional regulator with XRE-family HTH domain
MVGQAIRHARRDVGMTQAALADRLGTSAPYVSSVETGRANLTVGQLAAVADAMEVELYVEFRVPVPFVEPEIPASPTYRAPRGSHRSRPGYSDS